MANPGCELLRPFCFLLRRHFSRQFSKFPKICNHFMASTASENFSDSEVDGTNKSKRQTEQFPKSPIFFPEIHGNSALYAHPISRQYVIKNLNISSSFVDGADTRIHGEGTTVTMNEVMAECTVSNVVPTKLLEFWISELKAFRGLLAVSSEDTSKQRTDCETSSSILMDELDSVLSFMHKNLDSIKKSATTFKRSSEKSHRDKAFLPTNLHLQSLSIKYENSSEFLSNVDSIRHDVTTVGAFTAQHTMEGQAGLELLWRSSPFLVIEELSSTSRNDKLQESDGPPFVTYPSTLHKFKIALNVAAIWSKISHFSSKNSRDFRMAGEILMSLLEEIRKNFDGQLPATISSLDEILIFVKSLLDNQHKPQTFPLSAEFIFRVSVLLKKVLLDFVGLTTSELTNVFLRECVVMSQMISATISAVLTAFYGSGRQLDAAVVDQMQEKGLLIYFESLLSCWTDEKIMLEDIIAGLEILRKINFKISTTETESQLDLNNQITVSALSFGEMEIHLPPLMSKNPETTNAKQIDTKTESKFSFKIFPVFLNVGINEAASLAARQEKIALQKSVNQFYGEKLLNYAGNTEKSDARLASARAEFKEQMSCTTTKNIGLLHAAQSLTGILDGLRLTMCKSAKDRTAMAVTLEQITVLKRISTSLPVFEFDRILTDMRRNGTRRENTVKNIGFARYAFIQEQVEHLPPIYQPPPGTYGKSET